MPNISPSYKRIIKFVAAVALLFLIATISLRMPFVQKYLTNKILTLLANNLDTEISVGKVKINYFDEATFDDILLLDQSSDTLLFASQLHVDISLFSFFDKKLDMDAITIHNPQINISTITDSTYNFSFLTELSEEETSKVNDDSKPWKINLDRVQMIDPEVNINIDSSNYLIREKEISVDFREFDINQGSFLLSYVSINTGVIEIINQTKEEKGNSSPSPFILPDLGIYLEVDELNIVDQEVQYISGIDSFNLNAINASLSELIWEKRKIQGDLHQLVVHSEYDLDLQEMATSITIDSNRYQLQNFSFATGRDRISGDINMVWSDDIDLSMDKFKGNISSATIQLFEDYIPENINLQQAPGITIKADKINFAGENWKANNINLQAGKVINYVGDFTFFSNQSIRADVRNLTTDLGKLELLIPAIKIPDSLRQFQQLSLQGRLAGTLDSLRLSDVVINQNDNMEAMINGTIINISDLDLLRFDLQVDHLVSDIKIWPFPRIEQLAIDSLGQIDYSGEFRGNLKNIKVAGRLNTDLGRSDLDLNIQLPEQQKDLAYEGRIGFTEFDLGTFLKRDDLSKLTLETRIEGQGTNFSSLNSRLEGTISDFYYKGYTYASISVDADIQDCKVKGKVLINDQNFQASFDGDIDYNKGVLASGVLDVDTINFAALSLLPTSASMSGQIESELALPLKNGDQAFVNIYNLILSDTSQMYQEDSVIITASRDQNITTLNWSSEFLQTEWKGNYRLLELPQAIGNTLDYYSLIEIDTLSDTSLMSENIAISANLDNIIPVDILMDQMQVGMSGGKLDIQMDFDTRKIDGLLDLDSLRYNDYLVENLSSRALDKGGDLQVTIDGINITSTGIFSFPTLRLISDFKGEGIYTQLIVQDSDQTPKLDIGVDITRKDSLVQLVIDKDFDWDDSKWSVDPQHFLAFRNGRVLMENLTIFDSTSFVRLSEMEETDEGIAIEFDRFDIDQVIRLISSSPPNVKGRLTGQIELREVYSNLYFLANTSVYDLKYENKPVGSIQITAQEDYASGRLSGTLDLIGSENDVIGEGYFDPKTRELGWEIFIGLMEMRLLDPFLVDIIKDSRGVMFGFINLAGTPDRLDVSGQLDFEDISTHIVVNNSRYQVDRHKIRFDNQKIDIGELELKDAKNNIAKVSGHINHDYFHDMQLDFNLSTDKFVFLNTTTVDNPIFYGTILMDADADISGPPELLDVSITGRSLDSTDITMSPFSETDAILKESFIRYGKPGESEEISANYLRKLARQYPFDVHLTLEVDEKSEFTFIVDPLSGDKLNCFGEGDLQVNLKPNGDQEIFGTYEVASGEYLFSYGDFISREFAIQPGGSIRFNGNPLDAQLDVSAIYNTYTTTYELIENEVNLTDSEKKAAQRRTNVQVLLSLTGSLLSPVIDLDIRIPELQSGSLVASVDRKLSELRSDPNELNNQVVGLLLFDSFIISSGVSTGLEGVGQSIALSSISNLITSELNRLSEKIIKGVDVNIDVNSYNSKYVNEGQGGTVTEVGLNVTKQLFNDRVSISAGGNFNIDNSRNVDDRFSSFVGDFVIEYKLTDSGNYRIRVFSRSDYDRLLNENTIRNGVSLYFTKDFDSKTDGNE